MYVIPFSMGPVGSSLSKMGVQVTDSPYVVASMGIMTRMGTPVMDKLAEGAEFVRCQHSLGRPLPLTGTTHLSLGGEASGVCVCEVLRRSCIAP